MRAAVLRAYRADLALEQVADSIDFDERSKGQIRMALMEACINIKEAAASESGKIFFVFKVASDRLLVQMHTEAPGIAQSDPVKAWGMKMLQTLMDEVHLNHTHQGFELLMTKYLRHAKKEAV